MAKKPATPKLPTLPYGLKKEDLEYPKGKFIDPDEHGLGWFHSIELYYIEDWGWVICTLPIQGPRQGSATFGQRYYGIKVDDTKDGVVRVGAGPHVKHKVKVYLAKARAKALKPLIERYKLGAEKAGMARDQLSSRRAQGSLRRRSGLGWW